MTWWKERNAATDFIRIELSRHAVREFGQRDKIGLATKAGLEFLPEDKVRRNASRDAIVQELESSLRRLQTDYIDLYQLHWPDPKVEIRAVAETFRELYESGKVRAIGVSNFSVAQMEEWLSVAPLHTCQPPYNLFEREAEQELLPFCRNHNIDTLLYGSLCRGLLTGKMTSDSSFSGDDLRQFDPKFHEPRYSQYLQAVRELQSLADSYGKTMAQFAVRWVLDQPGCSVALWGARHPEQVNEMAGVSDWIISADDLAKVEVILQTTVTNPVGPEFMAPPNE